jgi:AcrR family transcriptional regulator
MRPTRDRIIQAASSLFYHQGLRSVGVDRIAEKAGITKRSLYYHFRSKDDLIAAYLEARDRPNLAAFRAWFDDAPGDAADKVEAIFAHLHDAARSPRWKGCGFLRSSAELVETPGHPALLTAERHKKQFEQWLADALREHGVSEPEAIARQVRLLIDGAFAVTLLSRDPSYFQSAGKAAATLIQISAAP